MEGPKIEDTPMTEETPATPVVQLDPEPTSELHLGPKTLLEYPKISMTTVLVKTNGFQEEEDSYWECDSKFISQLRKSRQRRWLPTGNTFICCRCRSKGTDKLKKFYSGTTTPRLKPAAARGNVDETWKELKAFGKLRLDSTH